MQPLSSDFASNLCFEEEPHVTEQRCPEQCEAFRAILEQMYQTHLEKNRDYSPMNILATGYKGLLTRLWDKMARLLSLEGLRWKVRCPKCGGEQCTIEAEWGEAGEPSYETIEDTLQDMAVYAIIGRIIRSGKWGR